MKFKVIVGESAEIDIEEIHAYVEQHESRERADSLLESIGLLLVSLADMPQRGHQPPELVKIGMHEYCEVHCKPYRIIYELMHDSVKVHAVLDGRRDLQTLLQQRLLR